MADTPTPDAQRIQHWLDEHRITEVECIIPDMAGQARGKIVPRHKYNPAVGLRLPEAVLAMTVTGDYPEKDYTSVADPDMLLRPDPIEPVRGIIEAALAKARSRQTATKPQTP